MRAELIFEVTEAEEGGYDAQALSESIFIQARTWEELKSNIQDAVNCHFDLSEKQPGRILITCIK